MCNYRVDTVDEEMLNKMKKAGCIGVAFGVESGVQEILDKCGKQTTLSEAKTAFKLMKKVGIEFHKTRPARLLLKKMATNPESIVTGDTSKRFEKIFDVINERLENLRKRNGKPFK